MVVIARSQLRSTARIAILFLFHLALYNCIRSPVFTNSHVPAFQTKKKTTVFNYTDFFYGRTLYVFGDSTVAAENFKLTKYPYGIDFSSLEYPWRRLPSGRFSNGFTIVDYIAIHMGSPIPRAFDGLEEEERSRFFSSGINFASPQCAILASNQKTERWSLGDQILNLHHFDSAGFGRSLFLLSVGRDDYIFLREEKDEFSEYSERLVTQFTSYLEVLYSKGARNFLINNIGPLGCVPYRRENSTKKCDERLNGKVGLYNSRLEMALLKFTMKYEEASLLLADNYKVSTQIMSDPSKFGFEVIDSPCCGDLAPEKNTYLCKGNATKFCWDRRLYYFFDGSHTSDAVNRIFMESCLSGRACYRPGKDFFSVKV